MKQYCLHSATVSSIVSYILLQYQAVFPTPCYSIKQCCLYPATVSNSVSYILLQYQRVFPISCYSMKQYCLHSATVSSSVSYILLQYQAVFPISCYSIKQCFLYPATVSSSVFYILIQRQAILPTFWCYMRQCFSWHIYYFTWQVTSLFTEIASVTEGRTALAALPVCRESGGPRALVQCTAVITRGLLTVFKKGAVNGFLPLADTDHIS
jgi:hypothetical protein